MNLIRIFIVDDHPLVIEGIKTLLVVDADMTVVGQTTRPTEVLAQLQKTAVDVLLMDINMPEINGLALAQTLLTAFSYLKILAISVYADGQTVQTLLAMGVKGYLLKDTSQQQLLTAIRTVAAGKIYLAEVPMQNMLETMQQNTDRSPQQLLTDREMDILRLIEQEYSNKRIAEALFISERTVETHRKNIFRKTQTDSVLGLIKFAYLHKLLD